MKKIISCILTLVLVFSMAGTVFAAEITPDSESKSGTTTISTTKDASYIVVIPERANITFDQESNPIGSITYKEGNLEPDAYVTVALTEKTALANLSDARYTIPYEIRSEGSAFSQVVYEEDTAPQTGTPLTAYISKKSWEEAKAGKYTATLTFTITYTDPHAE